MSRIASCVARLIDHIPLVRVNSLITIDAHVVAKLKAFDPASSMKGRIAASIIDVTEISGELNPGSTIIEAASGSTGIALAMVDAARGHRVVIVMPGSMSIEHRIIVRVFGAEPALTDPKSGVAITAVEAKRIHDRRPGSVIASQFNNPVNPVTHVATTGEEIWADVKGQIDVFVTGISTGSTILGIMRSLKVKNLSVIIIAVQPTESPPLAGGSAGPHGIQGLMPGFLSSNYDASLISEVVSVKTVEALEYACRVAAKEGLFVGISSRAAFAGTTLVVTCEEFAGKTIVILLPDTDKRHLSAALFDDLRE